MGCGGIIRLGVFRGVRIVVLLVAVSRLLLVLIAVISGSFVSLCCLLSTGIPAF